MALSLYDLNNNKATKAVATISVDGLLSAMDKTKLDGIATNANNYTHPSNHTPSVITQDANNRFVTDTEKSTWNAKAPSASPTFTGTVTLPSGTTKVGQTTLTQGGVVTITLPTTADTLVGKATTDTLTNKTLTTPTISSIKNTGTLTLPTSTDTLVGRATTDTLTNKTLTTPVLTTPKMTSGTSINDSNGAELIKFPSAVAGAVNEITVWNNPTGGSPIIEATGTDTNISLNLASKGIGTVRANGNTIWHAGNLTPSNYSLTSHTHTNIATISAPDGDRNPNTKLPTTTINAVRFDFANSTYCGTGGTYAGVMTYAPWDGTTNSTGDASYQLAFGSTATNGSGIPQLNIRNGIDSTWNTWYTLLHSGNYKTYTQTTKSATITTTWSGSSAPYTQTIAVSGITANDKPIISPVYSTTNATAILEKAAWNMIGKITTGTNSITVICFENKPTQAITIQIMGG